MYRTNKTVNASYSGSGDRWNRGHLAMRADANRIAPQYGCNTHVFANAVPQTPILNHGIWLSVENYVSSMANQRGELWVVAGPIYFRGKVFASIGEANKQEIPVAIPDALFKVVFLEQPEGVEVLSFIFPNTFDSAPQEYKTGNCDSDTDYDIQPFIVSLLDVEQATGLTFFTDSDEDLSAYKSQRAIALPAIHREHAVGYCFPSGQVEDD